MYGLWPVVICTQAQQSLGIITACVPYLKPFFAGLSSGILRNDDIRRRVGRGKGYQAIAGTGIHAFFEEEGDGKVQHDRGPPVPLKDFPPSKVSRPSFRQERVRSEHSRLDDGNLLNTMNSISGPFPGTKSLNPYGSDYIILPHERNASEEPLEMQSFG